MSFQPLTKEQYQKAIDSGFSSDQVIAMEKKRKEQNAVQPEGYLSRVWGDYMKAANYAIEGVKQGAQQEIQGLNNENPIKGALGFYGGLARTALRPIGAVAGAAFSPITEAPGIKQGLEVAGGAIQKIPGVEELQQKIAELQKNNPQIAKDLGDIFNTAILIGGGKTTASAGKELERAGQSIERSGIATAKAEKEKFTQSLVSPIETKAVKEAQVGRTVESGKFFKSDVVQPTPMEAAFAKEVSQIPGISSKNTFQKNFNIIKEFNSKQAKQLESDVAKYDFIIPKRNILAQLRNSAEELQSSPLIVGDAEKTAAKLIKGAEEIIAKNKGTGSGLLKARKEFDAWVLKQKPKVFDAKAENAFTIANDKVRRTLNDILDNHATNLGVKDSLRKQSLLYRSMENIGVKAAQEANSPFLRMLDRVGKVLGVKSRIVQGVAAAVGIGGLGAAATFAPAAAVLGGTGFILYKGGRLVMSAQAKIALGRLLKQAGHILTPEEKNLIKEAIKNYPSE